MKDRDAILSDVNMEYSLDKLYTNTCVTILMGVWDQQSLGCQSLCPQCVTALSGNTSPAMEPSLSKPP